MLSLLGKRSVVVLLMAALVVPIIVVPQTTFAQQTGNPTATTQGASPGNPPKCADGNFWPGWLSSVDCFFGMVIAVVGGIFVGLFGWVLGVVGTVFSFAITYTIVQFGGDAGVYALVRSGVETAWGVFRDLANIVIVGSLVFVAIATILGLESFGMRKFLARIIVVAILINFSLFFTKFTIDASHIVARAFYQPIETMAGAEASNSSVVGTALGNEVPPGVAGALMQTLGVAKVLDAPGVLKNIATQGGTSSTVNTLIYTILTSMLFLATAVVLAYGAYLLVVRVVALIFLIMLSAVALAASAVPGLEKQWKRWREEFVQNLLFAPALMMFLWATLTIAGGMTKGNGNIASLITDPTNGGTVLALFTYGIIIGMLYLSIDLAQKMSVRGAKDLPGLKDQMLKFGAGAAAGAVGANNYARYWRSRRAADKIESGSVQQQIADANAKGDKKAAEAASRRLNRLQLRADGKFNTPLKDRAILGGISPLVTGVDLVKRTTTAIKEGAGKKGAAGQRAEAEKENVKAVEAAGKQAAPQKGEKTSFVQNEAEKRVVEQSDDAGLRTAQDALAREREKQKATRDEYVRLAGKTDRSQEETEEMNKQQENLRKAGANIEKAQQQVAAEERRVIEQITSGDTERFKQIQRAVTEELNQKKDELEKMSPSDPRYTASRRTLAQREEWDARQNLARENVISNNADGSELAAASLRNQWKEKVAKDKKVKTWKEVIESAEGDDDEKGDGKKKGEEKKPEAEKKSE
jgi:hypothetical protein